MNKVYYNDNDPACCAWIRELVRAKMIPDGEVDERSIADVRPEELRGFGQCHFFAGIGGWSYALRLAGWPDDRPVWTGSCPCQPFSAAGKRKGTADARHLWPEFYRLIGECRPPVVFGEQVEAAIRLGWLDGVFADLEGCGYACGSAVLPAAGVGAPHIRHRIWWVAESEHARSSRPGSNAQPEGTFIEPCNTDREEGTTDGGLAESDLPRRQTTVRPDRLQEWNEPEQGCSAVAGGLADAGRECGRAVRTEPGQDQSRANIHDQRCGADGWSDFDVIPCRDGKARRVEPGTFPLADGVPARVGRLRGYGNAIVPQVAAEFVKAYQETTEQ